MPRAALAAFLLLAAATAGCQAPPPDVTVDGRVLPDPASDPLPPLRFEGGFTAAAAGPAGEGPCSGGATGCAEHGFEVPEGHTVQAVATLTWQATSADLDLVLADASGNARSADHGAGANATVAATLEPGSYRLRVVAVHAVQANYVAKLDFGTPPPA